MQPSGSCWKHKTFGESQSAMVPDSYSIHNKDLFKECNGTKKTTSKVKQTKENFFNMLLSPFYLPICNTLRKEKFLWIIYLPIIPNHNVYHPK